MIDTWIAELPHGIALSCRSSGARGRPVLMFLHGFPEAAFVWDELLEHFARPENGGYRCVAPNLRGYEQSSSPADVAAYHPKQLVQDIVALIAAEGGRAAAFAANITKADDCAAAVEAAKAAQADADGHTGSWSRRWEGGTLGRGRGKARDHCPRSGVRGPRSEVGAPRRAD